MEHPKLVADSEARGQESLRFLSFFLTGVDGVNTVLGMYEASKPHESGRTRSVNAGSVGTFPSENNRHSRVVYAGRPQAI